MYWSVGVINIPYPYYPIFRSLQAYHLCYCELQLPHCAAHRSFTSAFECPWCNLPSHSLWWLIFIVTLARLKSNQKTEVIYFWEYLWGHFLRDQLGIFNRNTGSTVPNKCGHTELKESGKLRWVPAFPVSVLLCRDVTCSLCPPTMMD